MTYWLLSALAICLSYVQLTQSIGDGVVPCKRAKRYWPPYDNSGGTNIGETDPCPEPSTTTVPPPPTEPPTTITVGCLEYGGLTEWEKWSECGDGDAESTRKRKCIHLPPGCVSIITPKCVGDREEKVDCPEPETEPPPTEDPCKGKTWEEWGPWDQCTHKCGACGKRQRIRICPAFDSKKPACGCTATMEFQKVVCNPEVCMHPANPCCDGYLINGNGPFFQCKARL
ncbi:hypothetical protein L596_030736 [Steinernema carpocapsae]|uniref:Uncharacterized protein n=1 Tax=Steinernema carpocapsae TaxID=34508 RepID=A0A4U5LNL6_STECR|nr:hypothetical protein L596_030736 [Steinernema carpocapsae]